MLDQNAINISKKEVEKAIVYELYKKNVIEFNQYNIIIKKLDAEICKLESKIQKKGNTKSSNLVVKVPI